MIKFGYITELSIQDGTVRVHFTDDDIVSNPLQVIVQGSKEDKYSFPFAINEHVSCLMDENCEFGVVLGAIYSTKNKPDAGVSNNSIDVNINNKLKLKIDRNTGDLKIESNGTVKITATKTEITAPLNTINGALSVTGAITAASFGGAGGGMAISPTGFSTSEDFKIGNLSLKNHIHISAGSGTPTSTPQ